MELDESFERALCRATCWYRVFAGEARCKGAHFFVLEIFSELKGKKFYLTGESVSTDLA